MKQKLFFYLTLLFFALSCTPEVEYFEMRLSKPNVYASVEAKTETITVTAPEQLTANPSEDWIRCYIQDNNNTTYDITIHVDENNGSDDRKGYVTLVSGKQERTINVIQEGTGISKPWMILSAISKQYSLENHYNILEYNKDNEHIKLVFSDHPVVNSLKNEYPEGIEVLNINAKTEKLKNIQHKDGYCILTFESKNKSEVFKLKYDTTFDVNFDTNNLKVFKGEYNSIKFTVDCPNLNNLKMSVIQQSGTQSEINRLSENEAQLDFVLSADKAVIKINFDNGITSKTYSINLEAYYFNIESAEIEAEYTSNSKTLDFTTNMTKDMFDIVSDYDWITISNITNNSVRISLSENDSEERTGTLRLVTENEDMNRSLWNITQTERNEKVQGCVWFEDPSMRKAIAKLYDINNDGQISYEEADVVEELNLSSLKLESSVGIEHFNNLRKLDISDNMISSLDLSGDHHFLSEIIADFNTETDVTGCRIILDVQGPHSVTALENHFFTGKTPNLLTRIKDDNISSDFSQDGKNHILQTHSVGKGIPIEIMIEGMLDVDVESGVYKEIALQTYNAIFEIEPVKSFKNRFDVSYTIKISKQRVDLDDSSRETAFMAKRKNNSNSVSYTLDDNHKVNETIIIFSNDYVRSYATTSLTENLLGRNICYYEKYDNLWKTIQHESVGHIIGWLGDEYEYTLKSYRIHYNITKNTELEKQIQCWQTLASYDNYYDELTTLYQIQDSEFYHTSKNSIMNDTYEEGGDNFNAISRYLIWERMMSLSGDENYNKSTEEKVKLFVEYDKINL